MGCYFTLIIFINIMREQIDKARKDVKRLTFASFVLLTTHCGLLLAGYRLPFAEILTVCVGFYLVYIISHRVFKFCMVMRAMLVYDYICFICVWIERYHGFGKWLTEARVLMFSTGIIIFVRICYLWCKKRVHLQ